VVLNPVVEDKVVVGEVVVIAPLVEIEALVCCIVVVKIVVVDCVPKVVIKTRSCSDTVRC